MNTKEKGDIAEAYVGASMLEKGWEVSKPFGDNYSYDYVVDMLDGRGFQKIQVKHGTYSKKTGHVLAYTNKYRTNVKKNIHYKKGEVDYFAIYCPQLRQCYIISFKEKEKQGKGQISLRVDQPKKNKHLKFKWAKDYKI